jgi:hypothetical protein
MDGIGKFRQWIFVIGCVRMLKSSSTEEFVILAFLKTMKQKMLSVILDLNIIRALTVFDNLRLHKIEVNKNILPSRYLLFRILHVIVTLEERAFQV